MPATNHLTLEGYVVAVESKYGADYYSVDLDCVKNTLKLAAPKRVDYIKARGVLLPSASTYACDLWIDTTMCPNKFWSTQGESDWRDLLIEETR